eukprot:6478674-Amphidinium_carterae.1
MDTGACANEVDGLDSDVEHTHISTQPAHPVSKRAAKRRVLHADADAACEQTQPTDMDFIAIEEPPVTTWTGLHDVLASFRHEAGLPPAEHVNGPQQGAGITAISPHTLAAGDTQEDVSDNLSGGEVLFILLPNNDMSWPLALKEAFFRCMWDLKLVGYLDQNARLKVRGITFTYFSCGASHAIWVIFCAQLWWPSLSSTLLSLCDIVLEVWADNKKRMGPFASTPVEVSCHEVKVGCTDNKKRS